MPSDVLSLARFNVRIILEVLSLDSFNERMMSVALSLVRFCVTYMKNFYLAIGVVTCYYVC